MVESDLMPDGRIRSDLVVLRFLTAKREDRPQLSHSLFRVEAKFKRFKSHQE